MPTLQQWFNTVDTDRSGKINAGELSKMPVSRKKRFLFLKKCFFSPPPPKFPGAPGSTPLAGKPIGNDVATKVVSIFDTQAGREISFFEYAAFFEFCSQAQTAFQAQDRSGTRKLNPQETGQALNQVRDVWEFSANFFHFFATGRLDGVSSSCGSAVSCSIASWPGGNRAGSLFESCAGHCRSATAVHRVGSG